MAEDDGGAGWWSFDSLSDKTVVRVLKYVDADTLLSCRLVCKLWRVLVDLYAFQEKAAEQNKWINGGRGHSSFSRVDADTVTKLDLPWFVFYAVCKHDPFDRNLVDHSPGPGKSETTCLEY